MKRSPRSILRVAAVIAALVAMLAAASPAAASAPAKGKASRTALAHLDAWLAKHPLKKKHHEKRLKSCPLGTARHLTHAFTDTAKIKHHAITKAEADLTAGKEHKHKITEISCLADLGRSGGFASFDVARSDLDFKADLPPGLFKTAKVAGGTLYFSTETGAPESGGSGGSATPPAEPAFGTCFAAWVPPISGFATVAGILRPGAVITDHQCRVAGTDVTRALLAKLKTLKA
jgi:hypothetical protein